MRLSAMSRERGAAPLTQRATYSGEMFWFTRNRF